MTRDEIIADFTTNIKQYQQYARNVGGDQDADDLFQLCTVMLLEFQEDRLISYWNEKEGLKPFFLRLLCNQYKSVTSKFHKEYRKPEQDLQKKADDIILNAPQSEDEYEASYFETISEACNSIYDHATSPAVAALEKMVWELYIETGSLRKALDAVPEIYQDLLDLKTVHVIVRKFQRTIKQRLNEAA